MTKLISIKTIAKKEILVPGCERHSWWNNSYELILVRRIIFLLVIISFPTIDFIVDVSFDNIGIDFMFFLSHFFIALDSGPHPLGMRICKICLLVMFLLGIFIGGILCVFFLRLFLCHLFFIIDSEWLTNHSSSQEGPLVFLLKVWSHLLEGMGFNTTGSPNSVRENFMDMKNPTRDEPMHNNDMAKFLEYTNQGIHSQGDSFTFPFFGNVGAPLMATLNIIGLNVGLLVSFCTTLNVTNSIDSSQIRTLCQGHRTCIDPSPSTYAKFTPPSPSSGKILDSSNKKYKRRRKRMSKKNKSPTYASHIGNLSPASKSHVGGKRPSSSIHVGSTSLVTASHTGSKSPTSMSHVGDISSTYENNVKY
jgi:hypothetical protein